MKKALGMIVRSLDSETTLMDFIENAEAHGHKLDCVIIAFTHQHDLGIELKIREKLPFVAVDIKNPDYCREQMRLRGISGKVAKMLLECPVDTKSGLVPYGFNRMIVVMEALLRGIDTLFFVDSDVYPKVLRKTSNGLVLDEVDFFGAHLEHLCSGSEVTTGEYSGYNILPPATFEGMDDFIAGVQKTDMQNYWKTSETHRCIILQHKKRIAKPCRKILGGNMAIKLSSFSKLPPFFSSYYTCNDELFLCRGEDTMLGLEIEKSGIKCTDIALNPLHDTYKNYPAEPNLRDDKAVQERFYYASTGWIGRNPLLNHILGNDLQATREYQRACLERGLRALSNYTSNPKFDNLINNFDVSWDNVGRYINEFEQVSEAWNNFQEGLGSYM